MPKKYTMDQIKDLWRRYKIETAWRIVRAGGQKSICFELPEFAVDPVVRCEMVKIRNVMGFPEYLEHVK